MNKVYTGPGTTVQEAAPWESYDSEMSQRLNPKLAAEVEEYAKRRYDDGLASSQSKEELARQREINGKISKEYQWLKPEEYADIEQRIGTVMTHSEFLYRLQKARVRCWYFRHPHEDKATLMVDRYDGAIVPEVACWAQIGYMPELSIMRFDDHGVPTNERRRGWRTCLLQIVMKGIISEEKAVKLFGHPKQTSAFARYNMTMQSLRNAGGRI